MIVVNYVVMLLILLFLLIVLLVNCVALVVNRVVLLLIVLLYVLFVCKYVLYYCHWLSTQLQLSNVSYHIISNHLSYHIISYRLSYHTILYHIYLIRIGRVFLSVNVETTDQHFYPDISTPVLSRQAVRKLVYFE